MGPTVEPGDIVLLVVKGYTTIKNLPVLRIIGERVVWRLFDTGDPLCVVYHELDSDPCLCKYFEDAMPGEVCWIETHWSVPPGVTKLHEGAEPRRMVMERPPPAPLRIAPTLPDDPAEDDPDAPALPEDDDARADAHEERVQLLYKAGMMTNFLRDLVALTPVTPEQGAAYQQAATGVAWFMDYAMTAEIE